MKNFLKNSFYLFSLNPPNRRYLNTAGNVLIYVVVLMLIFGALGVVMVSMFTSSTASTVTRNDTRRARYLSESGVRYAISELRKTDFEEDNIIDTLNTLTYTVSGAGSFDINIFGPWFDSNASVVSPPDISLSPHFGELPEDFTASALTGVWAVNYEYITGLGPDITPMRDVVVSFTRDDETNLTADITSDFVVAEGERVCLAVEPTEDRTINEGGDLYVFRDARLFFPPFNGAINIDRVDYAYERLVDDPDNNRVILENVTASQFPPPPPPLSAFPLSVAADSGGTYSGDFVILSPRNYMVMAEGTSDLVTWGNDYARGVNIYDDSMMRPGSAPPDITADDLTSNLSAQASDPQFFGVDTGADTLRIGRRLSDEFGSAFFDADMSIGGDQDYCAQGACLFALGVRAFFLLKFNNQEQGDGVTFTLLGKGLPAPLTPNNSATSVGGDSQLSELMGYAGDSRLVPNADPMDNADFVASNEDDRGLEPPKIAVEFDTRTNEPTFNLCSGANANQDTRNDPVPDGVDNKDVVQYVFWGREALNLPCRSGADNSTYDDNRHNPDDWAAPTGGDVRSSPAVGADGTIYVGSNDGNVYAFNPDGTPKGGSWPFNTGGAVQSSPAVDPVDGTIYVGSNDFNVYAINPGGTLKWEFATGGEVRSSPAIAADRSIYVGSDDGILYAFDRDADPDGDNVGETKWTLPNPRNVGAKFSFGRPAIGPDGTIYVSDQVDAIFAVDPSDGSEKWTRSLGDDNLYMPGVDPVNGVVYTDVLGNSLSARNPANGFQIWSVGVGADIDSTPVVGIVGSERTIYFGTDAPTRALVAVDAVTRSIDWEFVTGGAVDNIPALNSDNTEIYVVSMDGNLYAVDNDGGEISRFPIPVIETSDGSALPNSSPAVGAEGTVYVGSTDNNLYAVGRLVDPSNIKTKLLTSENLDSAVLVNSAADWLNGAGSRGSWAVRLEVDRALLPNVDGNFDYDLRLWVRQCPDQDDDPCDNILGTFYQDTRIEYDYTAVVDLPLRQSFSLSAGVQALFESFFFGFTGAAGAQALDVTISQFQLSFIRPGDPVVDCDRTNWPLEDSPPLPNCTEIN